MKERKDIKFIDMLGYQPGIIKDYLRGLEPKPKDEIFEAKSAGYMAAIRRLCCSEVQKDIADDYKKEIQTRNIVQLIRENAAAWAEAENPADFPETDFEKLANDDYFLSKAVEHFQKALWDNKSYQQIYWETAAAVAKECALDTLQKAKAKPVMNPQYRKISESLGWEVLEYGGELGDLFSLIRESPLGDTVSVSFAHNHDIIRKARIAADEFDPEKNAKSWVIYFYENNIKNGPTLSELLEDAEIIQQMLEDLACALENSV